MKKYNSNKKLENLTKRGFKLLGYLLKLGLIIYLIISLRKGNLDYAFWLMSISLALTAILSTTIKKKEDYNNISRDFVYSALFLIIAISAGGILSLFGEGFSAYHIFIQGHFNLESILTGFSFSIYSIVLLGIVFGSSYFINAVLELLKINLKEDKRPI